MYDSMHRESDYVSKQLHHMLGNILRRYNTLSNVGGDQFEAFYKIRLTEL
jgi:hypothetical protein